MSPPVRDTSFAGHDIIRFLLLAPVYACFARREVATSTLIRQKLRKTTRNQLMRRFLAIVICSAALACGRSESTVATTDQAATAAALGTVNVAHALDLQAFLSPKYIANNGSCIATEPAPARSRMIYVLAPDRSLYVRFNVVTSRDGSRLEMLDLARGVGDRRIWYATLGRGSRIMQARTFASQADKNPVVIDLPIEGTDGQRLVQLARLAVDGPCGSSRL